MLYVKGLDGYGVGKVTEFAEFRIELGRVLVYMSQAVKNISF